MLGFLSEIVQKVDAGELKERLKLAIEGRTGRGGRMSAIRICALDELGQDEALRVDVDDFSIAIVKDSSGTVHAIGDTCTHGDISLSEASSRARRSSAGLTAPSSRCSPASRCPFRPMSRFPSTA